MDTNPHLLHHSLESASAQNQQPCWGMAVTKAKIQSFNSLATERGWRVFDHFKTGGMNIPISYQALTLLAIVTFQKKSWFDESSSPNSRLSEKLFS